MIFLNMDEAYRESPISRSYLERLSTEELIGMADHYGVDVPPDLERAFVIEQLLELTEDEDESGGGESDALPAAPLNEADFPEQACLPERYNISFMDVMIRDPLWAFVFWELRLAEKENLEASPDFEGYYLKVSSVTAGGEDRVSFSVPLENDDTAWYLGFPPDGERKKSEGVSYRVELCAQKGGVELPLVSSAVFRLPALAPKKGEKTDGIQKPSDFMPLENSLAALSGIDDLPILRNGDRQSRMKVRGNPFPG